MSTYLQGPGGTRYPIFAEGANGSAGVVDLGDGNFRIRIKPKSKTAAAAMAGSLPDWTQPSDKNLRFSIAVEGDEAKEAAMAAARTALG